jgi:hypothetical protein
MSLSAEAIFNKSPDGPRTSAEVAEGFNLSLAFASFEIAGRSKDTYRSFSLNNFVVPGFLQPDVMINALQGEFRDVVGVDGSGTEAAQVLRRDRRERTALGLEPSWAVILGEGVLRRAVALMPPEEAGEQLRIVAANIRADSEDGRQLGVRILPRDSMLLPSPLPITVLYDKSGKPSGAYTEGVWVPSVWETEPGEVAKRDRAVSLAGALALGPDESRLLVESML